MITAVVILALAAVVAVALHIRKGTR